MQEIAQTRPWRDRANSMGYIPGGTEEQISMLRQVLIQLPCASETTIIWRNSEGREIPARCDELCRHQLSSAGLVVRRGTEWCASKFAKEWLGNQDSDFLAAHLHANVKFFGELLDSISTSTTTADLLEIATKIYGLNWASLDQVRRRIGWLRSLGMLEQWNRQVVLTSAGRKFLAKISLCAPEDAASDLAGSREQPDIAKEAAEYVAEMSEMDQETLRARRALIGYIPRGRDSTSRESEDSGMTPSAAVRKLIAIVRSGISVEDFQNSCSKDLGIGKSSAQAALHTLRHMGMIEQTALNYFTPTADAEWLTGVGNEQILAAFMHARYSFFGEILKYLSSPSTTSALTMLAKERYGYTQATNGEIRQRLGFLQDAGFVERIDWHRFRATAAGSAFSELLSLQQEEVVSLDGSGESGNAETSDGDIPTATRLPHQLVDELHRYGNDGNASKSFEIAVSEVFRFLGYHTEHLGGPGRTDVLAIARLAPGDGYRVIVDAKCSGNGVVAESGVNFDALRDHKKKHKADYVVVVGPDFANRLKDWAVDNGVVMLQIDDLASALKRHSLNPLSLAEMREVLGRPDAHRDELADRYSAAERRATLVEKILDLAFQEATDEDPIAGGFVGIDNILYALRKEVSPRPSMDEVQTLLEFLSSPMVGAVEENNGRYKLVDSLGNVALRLGGLGVYTSREILKARSTA